MTQTTSPSTAALSSKWQPYPAYKDSGVEWLGEIPAHWEVKRLKNIVTMNPEVLPEDTDPDYIIKYVDISNVDANGSVLGTQELRFEDAPSRARRIVKRGDTIISTVRTYLRAISLILHPPENLVVSTGFAVLRPGQDIHDQFLWRLVQSNGFVDAVVSHSEGVGYPAINPGILAGLPVWLPPLPEQRAIAAFLDRETARVNALIAKKERLIALLQEKRAALISHAVTKGLDPAAPVKDSGVEWLGEIPAHWEVKKIKRFCQVRRGASPRPIDDPIYFDDEGEYAWVRISDVSASSKYLLKTEQKLSALGQSKSVPLNPGELFLSIAGTVGKPIITQIKCCIHDGFVYFTGLKQNREYLFYVFSGGDLYKGLGKLGTQLNLNTDTIGDIKMPVPSPAEQQAIAIYLDHETAKIDALIARVREGIAKVQEYSAALIAAAVTGKIDVREVV